MLETFSYLAIKKSDAFLAPDLDFVSFVYSLYHIRPDSNPGKSNKGAVKKLNELIS